ELDVAAVPREQCAELGLGHVQERSEERCRALGARREGLTLLGDLELGYLLLVDPHGVALDRTREDDSVRVEDLAAVCGQVAGRDAVRESLGRDRLRAEYLDVDEAHAEDEEREHSSEERRVGKEGRDRR